MPISLTTPAGSEARRQVIAALKAFDEPMTTSQLYNHVTVVSRQDDLSTIVREMIEAGDIQRTPEKIKHNGMSKYAYSLAKRQNSITDEGCARLVGVLAKDVELMESFNSVPCEEIEQINSYDPILEAIDKLPLARITDATQRASRLRRLAQRVEKHAPDLAAELYEDATLIEGMAA